jgi:hypothetical protein
VSGRLKKHYVAVDVPRGAWAVYEQDPNIAATYRLWLDDLSFTRAREVALALNELETSRSKARRADAERRKNATT